MLLGGLTAADTSRTDVRITTATGDRAAGRATDRSARHGSGAAREQRLFVRRGHRFEHSERRDTPDSGGRRVCRPRRAAACAELGSVGRRDRGHRLCRRRLHGLGLAGHDRRVAAGQRATSRCPSPLRSSVCRGRRGGRAARDRRWLARERLGERGRPRLPARLDDGRPDRPPPRPDDPRGRGHAGRHRLRDRRPRSCARHAGQPDRRRRPAHAPDQGWPERSSRHAPTSPRPRSATGFWWPAAAVRAARRRSSACSARG